MAEEPVPAVRQRKKRKWDQPAEAPVSPAMSVPLMQLGGTIPLTSLGMPNMMTMMGGYMGLNMASMSMPAASPLPSNNSAAAIVHKINQELIAKGLMLPSKVHDEVISREIVINDADPGVRYKLTKRQTQEEIQSKTGAVVITRGRFRASNGPPDLEKPLYLHISAGVQLKDTAERIKAVDAATALVEEMMKQGPPAGALQSGGQGGPAFSAVVNVGIEGDPSFNLIGRIRGPNDQYIKHIMTETGAEVGIRGRGSGYIDPLTGEDLQQPLHLFISSEHSKSLDDARRLSENLLDTIRADNIAFRPTSSQPTANGPPSMYNHGGAPYMPSGMGQYAYHQSTSVYPTQVGTQYPGVQFQPSRYLPGSQPEIPGSFSQAAASARSLMDPYANMRPPSKSYAAVPPPQQLLASGTLAATTDSSSSLRSGSDARPEGQESPTTSTSSEPSFSVASSVYSGPFHPLLNSNYRPQSNPPYHIATGAVPHSNSSYPRPAPTYGGYGGVYPQVSPLQQVTVSPLQQVTVSPLQQVTVSPLQQVTSVLQRPPLPLIVTPGLVDSSGVVPPGTEGALPASHSGPITRPSEQIATGSVQRERRKFQEFPVAARNVAMEILSQHQIVGLAKQDAIVSTSTTASVNMPPPPPKFNPPPPKFAPALLSVANSPPPRPAPLGPGEGVGELKQDGVKLVEYGEEDDEAPEQSTDTTKAENVRPSLHPNGKPFWAAP